MAWLDNWTGGRDGRHFLSGPGSAADDQPGVFVVADGLARAACRPGRILRRDVRIIDALFRSEKSAKFEEV